MSILFKKSRKKSKAQAMVEFGLALPILLLVMYGLIEAGRLLFIYASVVSAARQAVRYGSATGDNGSGTPYYDDCTGIRTAAKRLGFIQPFQDSNIQISYDNGPAAAHPWSQTACPIIPVGDPPEHPDNGDRIHVRVSTQYSPIVPLVPFKPFNISSSGTRTLLIGVSVEVTSQGVVVEGGTGAISMSKYATPDSYDTLGQTITYTYVIHNLGTFPITDLTVTDVPLGAVSCPTTIGVGSSVTCTLNHTIGQPDIDAGFITNVATATGLSDVPVTYIASATIRFVPKPKLTLSKYGDSPDLIGRGVPITYTYTLTNTGNVLLSAPYTIADSNLDSWTCAAANSSKPTLALNDSVQCTGTHALTNNDINRTYVDNSATATALYGAYVVTSNVATFHFLAPELQLVVTADPTSGITQLGQTITYTYTLTNRTVSGMSGIKINDSRLGTFQCPWTTLASGASNSCTRTYSGYTQADMDGGLISDTASATALGGVNSNSWTVTVAVTQNAVLTLTKTATPGTATTAGTIVTYTYTFKNTGNVTLSGPYTIADNRISSVNCSGATGTMAPGATKSCANATYTVLDADIKAGSIINKATVSAVFGTTPVSSAPASALVITYTAPRLGLQKTANPTAFTSLDQNIDYSYTVMNTGGVDLSGPYSVQDNSILGGVDCSSANSSSPTLPIGGSVVCTGSYPISQTDMNNGSVTNYATAKAMNGATPIFSTEPSPTQLTINRFICDAAHLKHTDPTPIPVGSDLIWTIVNNTGMTVHIASVTVSWNAGPVFVQDLLGGVSIYGPAGSSSNGGFILPGGPWDLPQGNTNMELKFSGQASGIRVVLTFVESGCGSVDSGVIYPSG